MPFVYRLRILLEQRETALEEAQRALAAKLAEVESAREMLRTLSRKADEAVATAKSAAKAITAPSDEAVSVNDLLSRVEKARSLERDAGFAKDEVLEQRIAVQDAEDAVEETRNQLAEAMRAVEVLRKHRERAEAKYRRAEEEREAGEMDEAGVAVFNRGRKSQS
jgi:flagellar biosynthesis chaperone FliJ